MKHTILIKELKKEWNNQIFIDYEKVNKARIKFKKRKNIIFLKIMEDI